MNGQSSFSDNNGREMLSRLRELNGDSYSIISLSDAMKLFRDKKILLDLKFSDNVVKYTEKVSACLVGKNSR